MYSDCGLIQSIHLTTREYDPAGSVALLIKWRNCHEKALHRSNWTDHSCDRGKLVGERNCIGAVDCELALADHVNQFNAGQYGAGRPEQFEVEHGLGHPLDGAMVLLDDVVQVFYLTHKDRHVASGVDRIDDRRMIDRYTALFHYLPEVPVAQRISCVPADADQDHVDRKAHICTLIFGTMLGDSLRVPRRDHHYLA